MTRREFHSWDEFRRRLLLRFGAAPVESPGNRLFAIKQKETVSAYVPEFEELSAQVIGLEDSYLEPISNNGLQTEMKEVLQLKEPSALENQKKSRCLKASRFNFKRKKKRIKRWFNTLSCRESWRKHKHENLQIVSGLVGFNVGDFRCHKEYGLARMGNWSQVRVEYSLLQGELFCKNTLPRKPAISSSMLPFYVYQMGVSDIQDNDKEMVADPVSLQLILDDLKSHMRHKWKSKHLQAVVGLQNNLSYALDVVTQPVTECKPTAAIFQLVLEQSVSHDCFLGSIWEKKTASWLGIVCGLAEGMMLKATLISAKLPETIRGSEWVTDSGRLQTGLEQLIHGDDEAYTKSIAYKSSSIWHRWRRKGELKEEHKTCETEDCVQSTLKVKREFLIQGQHHDSAENSWMFSKAFVRLYHNFKLEDKLIFQEGSIDTIKRRKKKEEFKGSFGMSQRVQILKKPQNETEGLPFEFESSCLNKY